jgi:hypothetical protein
MPQRTVCLQHCTVQSAEQNDRLPVTASLMLQTVIPTESHNTQSVYSTVLYCTLLYCQLNKMADIF